MTSRITTVAFDGIDVVSIDVQVHINSGLPTFQIVGLADKAVSEARERIRSALSSLGLSLPAKRITVNLAPADMPKEGSHYDLPIALAVLGAMHIIPSDMVQECLAVGELSLDGRIQSVSGILAAAFKSFQEDLIFICSHHSRQEAAWIDDIKILAPQSLLDIIHHFQGIQTLAPVHFEERTLSQMNDQRVPDLRDIRGQETAKRALEIAAAGGHNLLMSGPPGAGKSMLASRLGGILPPLSSVESLEVSMIASIAGTLNKQQIITQRPYRSPHHSASMAALIGGGRHANPGEITLAHRGVLFLDELPEFHSHTLDALRQPLEMGKAVIARAERHVTYPARFQLIAAMNPCKCGYLSDPSRACSRAPRCAQIYQSKISGPLLDRFDLYLELTAVSPRDLALPPSKEGSKEVAVRVCKARERQKQRFERHNLPYFINQDIDGEELNTLISLEDKAKETLLKAADLMKLTARGYYRILRVSRTIADLDLSHEENAPLHHHHIAEALALRHFVSL
jgi:magnesium chelatase family protein